MWTASFVVLITLLQILPQQGSSQDTISCVNPHGQSGTCINIRKCPPLLQILRTQGQAAGDFLRASVCGYEGFDPRVCCSNGTNNKSTDNDSRGRKEEQTNSYGPLLPPDCGINNGQHSKIVDGKPAILGSWPWITALGYRNKQNPEKPRFLCGGSLVSTRHVITAGHCVFHRTDLYMIRVGDLDLESPFDDADPKDVIIEKKILHPQYNPTSYTNDIAVLRLAEDIEFSPNIRPICLPISEKLRSKNFERTFPFIAGWGSVYFNGPSSSRLLEAQLPVVKQQDCKNVYKSFSTAVIDDRVLCAGFTRGGRDACQGDSGGPLMTPSNKSFYLIGVVSYGIRCAEPGYPGVYTRVTSFLDFIIDNLV